VNGANQNVAYKNVAASTSNGQYMTQTLVCNGFGAGATIKDGEVFTIAGVFAWDNRKQQAQMSIFSSSVSWVTTG
jgi:hypothetical protein